MRAAIDCCGDGKSITLRLLLPLGGVGNDMLSMYGC